MELFATWFAPPRHLILPILAAWLGLVLAERRSGKSGVSRDALNDLVFYSIGAFVLAGRLVFAVLQLSAFSSSPLSLLSPNPDLFDPLGGLAGALLTALILIQRKRLAVWKTLDALVPFFAMLAVGIGLMHLAAGTAFGRPADLAWAIHLWNAERHPSQLYEILAAMIILAITWFSRLPERPGVSFLIFIALSSTARLFLEAFRGDSVLLPGGFRQAQVAALLVLAICFHLLERQLNRFDLTMESRLPSGEQ